jgi:hypothetical protein
MSTINPPLHDPVGFGYSHTVVIDVTLILQ